MTTRGSYSQLCSTQCRNRSADAWSRRSWTRMSNTTPCWSTARHSQWRLPQIFSSTSSRCHLSPDCARRRRSPGRVRWAELGAPLADRLVADDDAALGKEILNVAKAQVEAKVQPDGVGDHLWRQAVATVGRRQDGGAAGHRTSLPAAQLDSDLELSSWPPGSVTYRP